MDFVAQTIDRYAKPGLLEATRREPPNLPDALRQKLLDLLISLTLEAVTIQLHGRMSELPVEEINWNQAPKHLWNEVIQLAVRNRKLELLMHTLARFYNWNVQIQEVEAEVREWLSSENSCA